MRSLTKLACPLALAPLLGACVSSVPPQPPTHTGDPAMQLGAFSISLSVQNLDASRAFYEKLGFLKIGGDESMNYLVMRNGDALVGLFHGMFEGNILTFNPGWDADQQTPEGFVDIRELHGRLTGAGVETTQETGLDGEGVGSFVVVDPDGNPVLIDQHVPKPGAE